MRNQHADSSYACSFIDFCKTGSLSFLISARMSAIPTAVVTSSSFWSTHVHTCMVRINPENNQTPPFALILFRQKGI